MSWFSKWAHTEPIFLQSVFCFCDSKWSLLLCKYLFVNLWFLSQRNDRPFWLIFELKIVFIVWSICAWKLYWINDRCCILLYQRSSIIWSFDVSKNFLLYSFKCFLLWTVFLHLCFMFSYLMLFSFFIQAFKGSWRENFLEFWLISWSAIRKLVSPSEKFNKARLLLCNLSYTYLRRELIKYSFWLLRIYACSLTHKFWFWRHIISSFAFL